MSTASITYPSSAAASPVQLHVQPQPQQVVPVLQQEEPAILTIHREPWKWGITLFAVVIVIAIMFLVLCLCYTTPPKHHSGLLGETADLAELITL